MKQKDVRIGGEYLTVVGVTRVRVRVLREAADTFRRTTRFVVARVDTGAVLPKARTAAALRDPDETMRARRRRMQADLHARARDAAQTVRRRERLR